MKSRVGSDRSKFSIKMISSSRCAFWYPICPITLYSYPLYSHFSIFTIPSAYFKSQKSYFGHKFWSSEFIDELIEGVGRQKRTEFLDRSEQLHFDHRGIHVFWLHFPVQTRRRHEFHCRVFLQTLIMSNVEKNEHFNCNFYKQSSVFYYLQGKEETRIEENTDRSPNNAMIKILSPLLQPISAFSVVPLPAFVPFSSASSSPSFPPSLVSSRVQPRHRSSSVSSSSGNPRRLVVCWPRGHLKYLN